MKHVCTAIAYLQGAMHALDQERKYTDGNSRELSVAYDQVETALMWLEKDRDFKADDDARNTYLSKRQPYLPPELMDVEELKKLTEGERIGMFGYDPLDEEPAE